MTPGYRYVVSYPDIRFLPSSNLQLSLILSVDNVEDLLWHLRRIYALKHYVITFWLFNVHDIHYPVVVGYLKREHLFAQFTVHLFELDDNLPFVDFHGSLSLKPALQAFQMNRVYSTCTVAWRY